MTAPSFGELPALPRPADFRARGGGSRWTIPESGPGAAVIDDCWPTKANPRVPAAYWAPLRPPFALEALDFFGVGGSASPAVWASAWWASRLRHLRFFQLS